MEREEITQLNVHVPRRLVNSIEVLGAVHGWSKRETVANAVEALVELMERHEGTAGNAGNDDIGDLYLELARVMPAGLAAMKVEGARLRDGRPGLIVDDEWIVANDSHGDLMVTRRESGQLGRIVHGRIEALADHRPEIAEIAPLTGANTVGPNDRYSDQV